MANERFFRGLCNGFICIFATEKLHRTVSVKTPQCVHTYTAPFESSHRSDYFRLIMTITLAFDSFKGSLSSAEVAEAFQEGLLSTLPHCTVRKAYVADGGEGTMTALVKSLNGQVVSTEVSDPLGRTVCARYGTIDCGRTAIVEMAEASGLTLLQPDERNPLAASTFGTGELVVHALKSGCRKVLMCIGGSATNDGGTGMLSALGFRFLDRKGNSLYGCGKSLEEIACIDDTAVMDEVRQTEFVVACDVTNPLYGPNGAAHVFAPQKGADSIMVDRLDSGLKNFAAAIRAYNGKDVTETAGGGAAGGMGAGLHALLGAKLEKGIDMVLDALHFDALLEGCDLVVTGEGCIDRQTVMGKAPSGILRRATDKDIPVVAIGGRVEWCDELRRSGFARIIEVSDPDMPKEKAMQRSIAYDNVKRVGREVGELKIKS